MSDGIFNLARMTVASSGTGNITLNAAVTGYLTFDQSGCSTAATGQRVSYGINDTTQSEAGRGVYYSSGPTLTRGSSTDGLKSTNSNSPINMSNAAQIFITPIANDLNNSFGQCYLQPTANQLQLSLVPYNGNKLTIDGFTQTIPSAGVTLLSTAQTLTSSTYYYVYAYMSSGTMFMEVSTTAYTSDSGSGVMIKSGDATRTLVGLTFTTTTAGGSSNFTSNATETASWFNPRLKALAPTRSGTLTTTNTSLAAITGATATPFVSFSLRPVISSVIGSLQIDTALVRVILTNGLDGVSTTAAAGYTTYDVRPASSGEVVMMFDTVTSNSLSEGRHYYTPIGFAGTGTATYTGVGAQVTIWG